MKLKYIVFLGLVLFQVKGCETSEKIDDFPLRPSRLVLNSFFTADSAWAFQLSKSLSVLDNAELTLVDTATIHIYKDGELIDNIIDSDEDGWYRSGTSVPELDAMYSIELTTPGINSVLSAEDFLPVPVSISDAGIDIIDSSFYTDIYYDPYFEDTIINSWGNLKGTFNITFRDPAGIDNYYQISIYSYISYPDYDNPKNELIELRQIHFSTEDPIADDNDSYMSELQFNDEIIDGQKYQLKLDFEDWDARVDKEYYIELLSLTRSSYLYKRSVKEYRNASGDPFSEPVLIYSNIENGYGIFAGYSQATKLVKLAK